MVGNLSNRLRYLDNAEGIPPFLLYSVSTLIIENYLYYLGLVLELGCILYLTFSIDNSLINSDLISYMNSTELI